MLTPQQREHEQNVEAIVALGCGVMMLVITISVWVVAAMWPTPKAPVSICERCGAVITASDHAQCREVNP